MKSIGIRNFNNRHEFFETLFPCQDTINVPGSFYPLAEIHFAGNLAWHEFLRDPTPPRAARRPGVRIDGGEPVA